MYYVPNLAIIGLIPGVVFLHSSLRELICPNVTPLQAGYLSEESPNWISDSVKAGLFQKSPFFVIRNGRAFIVCQLIS
jgi:hypothetical protein